MGGARRARGPAAALHWHPPSHPAQCCSSPLPPSLLLPHPHPSLSPAPLRLPPPSKLSAGQWYTASETHKDGSLHGFQDTFRGFGVIFDTFVNSDPGHVHKDIKLVTSDGSSAAKDEATPIGCDADFRYWEGRDDVSVYNHSAVRIRFAGGRVSLWVDAKASGNFVQCFDSASLAPGLAEGWWREGAWLGLTATTGDLADNHDLLSLLTGPEDEVAPKNWLDPRPELLPSGNEEIDRAIRSAIAYETWDVKDRLSFLEHKLEHECV